MVMPRSSIPIAHARSASFTSSSPTPTPSAAPTRPGRRSPVASLSINAKIRQAQRLAQDMAVSRGACPRLTRPACSIWARTAPGRQSVSLPCPFRHMQKPFERDSALHSDIGIYERDLDGTHRRRRDRGPQGARRKHNITIRVKEAEDLTARRSSRPPLLRCARTAARGGSRPASWPAPPGQRSP